MKEKANIVFIAMLCMLWSGTTMAEQDCKPLEDANILAIYDQINRIEIENAQYASQDASMKSTQGVAQMIMEEHIPIRETARKLAREAGITAALPACYETLWGEKELRLHLEQAAGIEFDMAYLAYERVFSEKVIEEIDKVLIPAARNTKVAQLLRKDLHRLRRHLEHISALQNRISMQGGSHER